MSNFMVNDSLYLTVADTIPEHDDLVRPDVVGFIELLKAFNEGHLKAVDELLAGVCLDNYNSVCTPTLHILLTRIRLLFVKQSY